MPGLDFSEVKQRVAASGPEVVDELYSFGEKLVSDAVERLAKSDSKAAALAAYSGGIITLAISTSPLWSKYLDIYSLIAVALAGVLFLTSAWRSVGSTHPQPTEWYSDNDWLRSECLQSRPQLRQYHVLTMWRVLRSHQEVFREKTKRISSAVLLLKIGFSLAFVAFLEVTWRHSSLQDLRVWIR